jgi:hypothetical protein
MDISKKAVQAIMAEIAPSYFAMGSDPRLDHRDILRDALTRYYADEGDLSRAEAVRRADRFVATAADRIPFKFDPAEANRLLAAAKLDVGLAEDLGIDEIEADADDDLREVMSEFGIGGPAFA